MQTNIAHNHDSRGFIRLRGHLGATETERIKRDLDWQRELLAKNERDLRAELNRISSWHPDAQRRWHTVGRVAHLKRGISVLQLRIRRGQTLEANDVAAYVAMKRRMRYLANRARCTAPVRRQRQSHRKVVVRVAAKAASSTGDPDPEPSRPRAPLSSFGGVA